MATMTIRLPDDKHERLKHLTEQRGLSLNKRFEEWSTVALTEFDAETRFRLLAGKGDANRALRGRDSGIAGVGRTVVVIADPPACRAAPQHRRPLLRGAGDPFSPPPPPRAPATGPVHPRRRGDPARSLVSDSRRTAGRLGGVDGRRGAGRAGRPAGGLRGSPPPW